MAIQWMDDFTAYGTDASRAARLLNGAYAENGASDLVADPDPTAGGQYCLKLIASGNGYVLRKVLSGPQVTVGIAGRYWLSSLPSSSSQRPVIARTSDVNNFHIIAITVDPSGYINVYRNDSGNSGGDTFFTATPTLIGSSSSPVMVANAWRHIETKVVHDATTGSVTVKIEGTTVVNLTGIRTTSSHAGVAATCSSIGVGNDWSGPNLYVKDYILWDSTGTVNNNFMGTCSVYKIVPSSDVSLNWTPSSGTTGYDKINETTPDDDTSYVSAPFPLPSPATFNMTDLPVNVTAVKGVMAVTRSRKTDAGDGQIKVSLVSGANTGDGSDRTITTAYTYWNDVFDKDPSGSNWSKTLVNALVLKLNRTV